MRATGSLVCHDTAPINLRSQTTLVGQHVAVQHAALGSIGAIPILRLSGVFGPRNMLRIVPTTPVAATGFSLERYQIVTTLLPNTRSQQNPWRSIFLSRGKCPAEAHFKPGSHSETSSRQKCRDALGEDLTWARIAYRFTDRNLWNVIFEVTHYPCGSHSTHVRWL